MNPEEPVKDNNQINEDNEFNKLDLSEIDMDHHRKLINTGQLFLNDGIYYNVIPHRFGRVKSPDGTFLYFETITRENNETRSINPYKVKPFDFDAKKQKLDDFLKENAVYNKKTKFWYSKAYHQS